MSAQKASAPRIDWVDYSKGICIILVVMMHTTLGIEKAAGDLSWLNPFIAWARPFRMPDFFMISGLFLAARIHKPWRDYADTKIVHFAYFYLLWMTIQFITKVPANMSDMSAVQLLESYAMGFIQPASTLWFIYVLAVFFLATRLLDGVPPILIFTGAAVLEILPIDTGWIAIDEFASRYVYFYTGYWLAAQIFAFASGVDRRGIGTILAGLFVWGYADAVLVFNGYAELPGISLVLGFIGALAVVSMGVLLSKFRIGHAIRYLGANSIVVYLAFFLFMGPARSILLKTGAISDLGTLALLITSFGVIGPLLLFWATRKTPLAFLFRRPQWAKLTTPVVPAARYKAYSA